MKSMKRWVFLASIVVVVLLIWWWLPSAGDDEPLTETVNKGDVIEKVTAVGSIVPRLEISVKSPIAGTVAALYRDAGEKVQQNDKLMEIKPDPTPEQYARAKQQVAIDNAKEEEAKADWERFRFLREKGAISKNDQSYSQAKARYEEARLQHGLSEQQLALLEKGIAEIGGRKIENVILSPISGSILQRNVNVGDPVVAQSSSQPGNVLFTIADMSDMVFKGQVSQIDAAKLQENMPANIQIAAIPNSTIAGTLTKLALQSVQEGERSEENTSKSPFNVGFTVEIGDLKTKEGLRLRAGYSATADIVIKEAKEVLILPERVLFFENAKPYVWVLIQHKVAEKTPVEIGVSDGVNVELLSGVSENQQVLVSSPEEEDVKTMQPRKKRGVRVR